MSSPTVSRPRLSPTRQDEREVVIKLEGISVRYRVPHERIGSFKEYAIRTLQRRVSYRDFWALQGVNLEVCKGEVLGIVGRNGAGKSTLLKVVARVLRPTRGRVWVKGRVAPLLELQAGFQPELSGRENILLNGTLLGFSRREMEEKFERIVDFAELWDFIDAPVRTYSSGMVARLGFAIATDARPDILIVDEVLSVGDEAFRRKSKARMQEFREQGATILLVSHTMESVREICSRAVWIDQGVVKASGPVVEVVRTYLPKRKDSAACNLIPPYGGKLVNLLVTDEAERRDLMDRARRLPSIQLSPRSLCDLELMATGAFSPLDRFMGEADYRRVLAEMRLADGTLWPIPITLPVAEDLRVQAGDRVALRGPGGELLAVMALEEKYRWDLESEARQVYGTLDPVHPLVREMGGWGRYYLSGPLRMLRVPKHDGFADLYRTPTELRRVLAATKPAHVVAFHAREPISRVQEELTKRIAAEVEGMLLIHVPVGVGLTGDLAPSLRVRCCQALVQHYYRHGQALLSLVSLAERHAGPREALWQAIVRRNYGADHFAVAGYANVGEDSRGRPFYQSGDPMMLVSQYGREIGVKPIPFRPMVYLPAEDRYEEQSQADGGQALSMSVAEAQRLYMGQGKAVPVWLMRPEVAAILAGASADARG